MKYRLIYLTTALSFGVLLSPLAALPAAAQTSDEMSADEIKDAFDRQKTRGLVLATPGAAAPDAATASTATAEAPATTANIESIATAIPKEDQVNINVSFDFDSASLREDQKPKLMTLCTALKAADVQAIRILGHTDASGSDAYNERLSKLRAEEVKRFLGTDCAFPLDRMEALGVGERFLFDPSDPKADANRRVEFQALS
ncbi:OmpA family protein [Loktanella salsilacus]|uniref:OmpA family protein n=1 Tax=Loktanella salsilacus TaxID=195913 RepID=UPI003002C91C